MSCYVVCAGIADPERIHMLLCSYDRVSAMLSQPAQLRKLMALIPRRDAELRNPACLWNGSLYRGTTLEAVRLTTSLESCSEHVSRQQAYKDACTHTHTQPKPKGPGTQIRNQAATNFRPQACKQLMPLSSPRTARR